MTTPIDLRWNRVPSLEDGENLDMIREGGVYRVTSPSNGPSSGSYLVTVYQTVNAGVRTIVQTAQSLSSGAMYTRVRGVGGWTNWSSVGAGGGGGGPASAAVDVSYDAGTAPTPGAATNLQSVIEELVAQQFPQGIPSREFNVLKYGADPTGAIECGDAFEDAIVACAAAGGGVIRAPAGMYKLGYRGSASLGLVRLRSNMVLQGDGQGITILKADDLGDNDVAGIVRTQSGVENSNVVVRDITLDGNAAGQTGWANIIGFFCGVTPDDRAHMDTDIWCINVEVKNTKNGDVGSSNPGRGYGFDPHEVVDRLVFINCTAVDCAHDGFIADGVLNGHWIGCRSIRSGRHGINFVKQSEYGRVIGCEVRDSGAVGILVQQNSHHFVIADNYVYNSGEQGIRVRSGDTIVNTYNKINNNTVEKSGRNGINLTGVQYDTVTNNTIIDSSQSATNTYFDIALDEDDGDGGIFIGAAYNVVANNLMVATASNKTKAAIREDSAASAVPNHNTYLWNIASGQLSGKFLDLNPNSDVIDAGYVAVYEAKYHGISASNSDNGTALRNLVDLVAERGGGTILLPPGDIRASGTGTASQGVVALPTGVSLKGQGRDITTLTAIDPVNNSITGVVRTKSGAANAGIVVSDLTVSSDDCSGTGDVTIGYVGGSSDSDIIWNNVKLTKGQNGSGSTGFGLRVTSSATRVQAINCWAYANEQDGFYWDGCSNFVASGCLSQGNGRYGYQVANGANAGQHVACEALSNTVNNFIVLADAYDQIFSGGACVSAGQDGFRIRRGSTTYATYVSINGMKIVGSGRAGLLISGAQNNVVTGNFFRGNGQSANNTYNDVTLNKDTTYTDTTAAYNLIEGNYFLANVSNKTKYAVSETAAEADNNTIANNVAIGQVQSARFQVQGSGSVLIAAAGYRDLLASTPGTPSSGNVRIHGSALRGSGLIVPAAITQPFGRVDELALSRFGKSEFAIIPQASGSAVTATGWSSNTLTTTGTPAAGTLATTSRLSALRRVEITSASSAGNTASAVPNSMNCVVRGSNPNVGGFTVSFTFAVVTKSANSRCFVGLKTNNTIVAGAALTGITNLVGVGWAAGDANLSMIHNDGSGDPTQVSLGTDFAVSDATLYELSLWAAANASPINYALRDLTNDRVATGVLSSDLPSSGTWMGPQWGIGNNSDASAVAIALGPFYAIQEN